MLFNALCAERLKAERERLKLSQQAAADLVPVRREMWSKYERGEAEPGASVLVALASAGANIHFIATGERDGQPPITLAADEEVLLDGYRALDATNRRRMLGFILGGQVTESNKQKNVAKEGGTQFNNMGGTQNNHSGSGVQQIFNAPVGQVTDKDIVNTGGTDDAGIQRKGRQSRGR